MGTLLRSYLDVLREIEAEKYTMRIAASRSFWKYRLEGPNPLKMMVYEGFRLRSTEVDRGRPKSRKCLRHFLVVLMDLEAQTLTELRSFCAPSVYMGFGSRFY